MAESENKQELRRAKAFADLGPNVRSYFDKATSSSSQRRDLTYEELLLRDELGASGIPRHEVEGNLLAAESDSDVEPNQESFAYQCLMLMEGEAPSLKHFPGPISLATYIAQHDGEDVYIIPFYGKRLPVTVGPQRFLLLPDDATALTVPVKNIGKPIELPIANLPPMTLQEDFFMGPHYLSGGLQIIEEIGKKPPRKKAERPTNKGGDGDSSGEKATK